MKHRNNITLLLISILLMLLLVALSGSTRSGSGPNVSPLAVQRPTLPGELTPMVNMPSVLFNFSALPTPTLRPTP